MKIGNIKKVLLPNLPYLFFLWAFLKIARYRLAEGADFAHKLIGLGRTIGPGLWPPLLLGSTPLTGWWGSRGP